MDYWDFNNDTVTDAQNIPLKADYHLPTQLSTPYGVVYYLGSNGVTSYTLQSNSELDLLANTSLSASTRITLPNGDTPRFLDIRWFDFGYKNKVIPDYFLALCGNFGSGFSGRTLYFPEECTRIGRYFLYMYQVTNMYFNNPIVLPGALATTSSQPAIGNYFLAYCTYFNQPIHIPAIDNSSGASTQIGDRFLFYCTAYNSLLTMDASVTRIGAHFLSVASPLSYTRYFNQPVAWVSQLEYIGSYFLDGQTGFNQPVTVNSNGVTIGSSFLEGCSSLASNVTLTGATSIGGYILYNCNSFSTANGARVIVGNTPVVASANNYSFATQSSSASEYTSGIKFEGETAADWVAAFPNSDTSPYRKTSEYKPYYGKVKYLDGNNEEQVAYLVTSAQYATTQNSTPSQISGLNLSCQDSYSSSSPTAITVAGDRIVAFEFGELATSTPNYFLGLATLREALRVPSSIASYGQGFLNGVKLYYGVTFDPPTISPTITSYFMSGVDWGSNSSVTPLTTLDIPEGFSGTGTFFMYNLSSTWSTQSSSNILQINLPASLVTIGNNAFGQLGSATAKYHVNFKEGLRSIGNYFGCTTVSNSRSIECSFGKFPSTLTTIGTRFLEYPGKVVGTIDLSDTAITSIPDNFMGGASSASASNKPSYTSILLPSGLTTIGNNCLYSYPGGIPPITLPSSITTYGNNFMANCVIDAGSNGVESDLVVNIPNATGNIVIGDYFLSLTRGTYSGTNGSVTLTLPQNLYSIGNYFCSGASIKEPFTLPTWAQSWGNSFMQSCSLLKDTSSSVVFTITEDLSLNPSGMPAVANHTADQTSLANYDNQYATIQNTPIPISIPDQWTVLTYKQLMETAFPSYNASGSGTNRWYRRPYNFITP